MRSAPRWRARWPPVLNEWVGDLSDSLKADLTNAPGPFRKSVREASETLKAEFADAGAEVVGPGCECGPAKRWLVIGERCGRGSWSGRVDRLAGNDPTASRETQRCLYLQDHRISEPHLEKSETWADDTKRGLVTVIPAMDEDLSGDLSPHAAAPRFCDQQNQAK